MRWYVALSLYEHTVQMSTMSGYERARAQLGSKLSEFNEIKAEPLQQRAVEGTGKIWAQQQSSIKFIWRPINVYTAEDWTGYNYGLTTIKVRTYTVRTRRS